MELLDTTATIETPERVCFRYRLAGPGQRAVAWGIDLAVQILVIATIVVLLIPLGFVPGLDGVGTGLMYFAMFLVQWFYGVAFETLLQGRTPGKLLLDLRVVRVDGSPGRFPDYLLRNLVRFADFLPVGFGIGVLTMVVDPRLRRLGDLVAGTVVVAEDKANVLAGVVLDPPVSEAERQALPPRVDLSHREIQVIEAFLRRRPKLSDERAEELARLLGPSLSERTGVQADTWERVLALAWARAVGYDRRAAEAPLSPARAADPRGARAQGDAARDDETRGDGAPTGATSAGAAERVEPGQAASPGPEAGGPAAAGATGADALARTGSADVAAGTGSADVAAGTGSADVAAGAGSADVAAGAERSAASGSGVEATRAGAAAIASGVAPGGPEGAA